MNWYLNRLCSDMIERSPRLYLTVQNRRLGRVAKTANRLVRPNSELVIEGFPRCANSYAVKAFRAANDPEDLMDIATHAHSPAVIIMGIRWDIPTLVLIREPEEAVLSKVAKVLEFDEIPGLDKTQPAEDPAVRRLVFYWTARFASFYARLRPYAGRFVAADFESVTRRFPNVMERLNQRYGKGYRAEEPTEANQRRIFESSAGHLSPSARRDAFREALREVYGGESNRSNKEQANVEFNWFCRANEV